MVLPLSTLIFEFFRDLLAMHNMKMHTAGSLMNGGRIWCLAQTGDVHKVLGVDRVDSYLLLSTSYDLTLSTLAQFTSVRVVCNNTLQQALRDSSGRVTIPHVREFNAEHIKDQLGIGREQWAAFTAALDVQVFGPELGLQQGARKLAAARREACVFLGREHDRRRLAVDSHRLRIAARGPLDELAEISLRLLQLPFVEHRVLRLSGQTGQNLAWTHHAWL